MQKKLHILINKNSGTVLRLGEEQAAQKLRDVFGDRIRTLEFLDTGNLCKEIHELRHEEDTDILIGGGDGSAVCAAEILKDRDIHFGVLPLGTMNLLAQDLGAAPTFEETLARIDRLYEDKIDLGLVNGKPFLCSAVIGVVPESALAREDLRSAPGLEPLSRFIGTIARGMRGEIKHQLNLRHSENDAPFALETTSLIISNNRFIRNPGMGPERFLRESLKDGRLAVYSAAPRDMMDGLRIALKMVQGTWQEDEAVFSFETPELIIDTPQDEALVSLDGEPMTMTSPLTFKIEEKALPVLRMELRA